MTPEPNTLKDIKSPPTTEYLRHLAGEDREPITFGVIRDSAWLGPALAMAGGLVAGIAIGYALFINKTPFELNQIADAKTKNIRLEATRQIHGPDAKVPGDLP